VEPGDLVRQAVKAFDHSPKRPSVRVLAFRQPIHRRYYQVDPNQLPGDHRLDLLSEKVSHSRQLSDQLATVTVDGMTSSIVLEVGPIGRTVTGSVRREQGSIARNAVRDARGRSTG
jgi:hypothetical protein